MSKKFNKLHLAQNINYSLGLFLVLWLVSSFVLAKLGIDHPRIIFQVLPIILIVLIILFWLMLSGPAPRNCNNIKSCRSGLRLVFAGNIINFISISLTILSGYMAKGGTSGIPMAVVYFLTLFLYVPGIFKIEGNRKFNNMENTDAI